MFDLIIRNATIIDGKNKPAYLSDIGIKKDRIEKIGNLAHAKAKEEINANNLILSPGFIDVHSHADVEILSTYKSIDKITQGVTTQIIGNCGFSVAPVKEENKAIWKNNVSEIVGYFDEVAWEWNRFGEYIDYIKQKKIGTNIVPLAGYGAIRNFFSGFQDFQYQKEEIKKIKDKIIEVFNEGAKGVSFGLIYAPTIFADKNEILEISKFIAKENKIISFHIRNEGNYLIDSIKEVIKIAQISQGNIEIAHLKALGKMNWNKKISECLDLINKANKDSCSIGFDQYPYTAASTYLKSVLPPWVSRNGDETLIHRIKNKQNRTIIKDEFKKPPKKGVGWDNFIYLINKDWGKIRITGIDSKKNQYLQGKSLKEISDIRNEEPEDAVLNLLIEENCRVTVIIFLISEEDMIRIMMNPYQKFGSDSIYSLHPHPRRYGSFPRVIRKYVREKNILKLEEAIQKMTYSAAQKFNIKDRGVIEEGKFADIAIFDFNDISDRSTYLKPNNYSEGIKFVILNGSIVYNDGKLIKLKGKVL